MRAILSSSGIVGLCPIFRLVFPSGSSFMVRQFRWNYVVLICLSMFAIWLFRLFIPVFSWVFFFACARDVGAICFGSLSVGYGFSGSVSG